MIIQKIKEQIKTAMKEKDAVKRDVLRLVVGQAQQSGDESDESLTKIIKKLIKSNKETLEAKRKSDEESGIMSGCFGTQEDIEIDILSSFIPKPLSKNEVIVILRNNKFDPGAAKNPGQAMGMAMKILKSTDCEIDAAVVKDAIGAFDSVTLAERSE